jgi:hypothetical protein
MVKLELERNLDWILQNIDLHKSGKDWKGNFVSHLLPDKFEKYIKVLHTIYEDTSIIDKEITWNQNKKKSFDIFKNRALIKLLTNATITTSTPSDGFIGKRIKWVDLCEKYNLPFTKTINVKSFIKQFPENSFPRYLVGPSEGILTKEEISELISLFKPYCNTDNCYFYYDSLVFGEIEQTALYQGQISELMELVDNEKMTFGYAPTYIWSSDKKWCINSDYDLSFSVIGCNREIADKLLSSSLLETIEIDINTRIDYKADELKTPLNPL